MFCTFHMMWLMGGLTLFILFPFSFLGLHTVPCLYVEREMCMCCIGRDKQGGSTRVTR